MKNTRLAITLAAFATSASFTFAQTEDELIHVALSNMLADRPIAQLIAGHEVQAAATHDQMKQVEQALAASRKTMQLAQARVGETSKMYGEAGKTYARAVAKAGPPTGSAGRALVIPKEATDAKILAEVEEDMSIMAHILDKAASDNGKSPRAMGIPVFGRFGGGGGSPQNLYLEGHGTLFFLNVNYPLLPAPDKGRDASAKEKVTSEWEQAREEMNRPRSAVGADVFVALGESFEREFLWNSGPPLPYDADKVEELKSDLISALKNAAHIRKLKGDETVTVVVTGASAAGGGGGKTVKSFGPGPGREEDAVIAERYGLKAGGSEPALAPAKLVLRVRKADAEAHQNGKLNLEEFRKKVTVMLY